MSRRRLGVAGAIAVILCALFIIGFAASSASAAPGGEGLARALEAQQKHGGRIMDIDGVVGVAAGDGEVLVLLLNQGAGRRVPARVDNVPIRTIVTGRIEALNTDPTSRHERPVPIGVSIGNEGEASAGTLGARVVDGAGNVYILSNNHVIALTNSATIGSRILQPGRYDGGSVNNGDVVAQLSEYVEIKFDGTSNRVDAAIAITEKSLVDTATPSNGYGIPSSTTRSATVGLNVQKYGRTTSLSSGSVTGVNATVNVGFGQGTARFEGQIIVEGKPGLLGAGDSGSLFVTNDSAKNPVGLLFAGDRPGKLAVANPIDEVLAAFGVSVDDSEPVVEPVTDIAITAISAPSSVEEGASANIEVTVANVGNQNVTDNILVTLDDDTDGVEIGAYTITGGLAAGASTVITFPWNTTGASLGDHNLTAWHDYSDDNAANDERSAIVAVIEEQEEPPAPEPISVTAIDPNSGAMGGTIIVQISGTGFVAGASVSFESGQGPAPSASGVEVLDANTITATVSIPSGGPKRNRSWSVRVTNPDGGSAVLVNGFTVTP